MLNPASSFICHLVPGSEAKAYLLEALSVICPSNSSTSARRGKPFNPPDYADLPVQNGEVQPLIRQKWIANSPLAMLDQHYTNLKKYSAIAIEVGTMDGLAGSNRDLDKAMTQLGVQHTFETYEGDHTNRVPERIEMNVLPFFSKVLSFTAPRSTAKR
jgi:hypothetical protein